MPGGSCHVGRVRFEEFDNLSDAFRNLFTLMQRNGPVCSDWGALFPAVFRELLVVAAFLEQKYNPALLFSETNA